MLYGHSAIYINGIIIIQLYKYLLQTVSPTAVKPNCMQYKKKSIVNTIVFAIWLTKYHISIILLELQHLQLQAMKNCIIEVLYYRLVIDIRDNECNKRVSKYKDRLIYFCLVWKDLAVIRNEQLLQLLRS